MPERCSFVSCKGGVGAGGGEREVGVDPSFPGEDGKNVGRYTEQPKLKNVL